jgi:CpeT protein
MRRHAGWSRGARAAQTISTLSVVPLLAAFTAFTATALAGPTPGGERAAGSACGWNWDGTSPEELETLGAWMTGLFSSHAQATADSTYHDVRLRMERIWNDREDGVWLYVEQAISGNEERPYRQRVYHLRIDSPHAYASDVYTLPAPERFVGGGDPIHAAALTPDSLELRDGCTILLERYDVGSFTGSTVLEHCPSSLAGATYATSKVTITPSSLSSWDRGFDAANHQVWGATEGAYRFDRVGDLGPGAPAAPPIGAHEG